MANIHQDGVSIENIQLLSSNRVHSTHSCEANKYGIFKPFFAYQIKGVQCIISNRITSLTISRVQILPHKMPFFWVFENDNILSSKSYTVTKSGISPQKKPGSL